MGPWPNFCFNIRTVIATKMMRLVPFGKIHVNKKVTTPLHAACKAERLDLVQVLWERIGPNKQNYNTIIQEWMDARHPGSKETAFIMAVRRGHLGVVDALLSAGADPAANRVDLVFFMPFVILKSWQNWSTMRE